MGANWGEVDAEGKMHINWNTPEYLKALEWFVDMAKYAPSGALGADGMPQGFLSDENVVAIIPEGEQGYFIQPLIANPELQKRFRSSFNFIPEGEYQVTSEFREFLGRNGFEVGVHDLHHNGKLYWSR